MRKLATIMLSFMLVFNLAGTTIANAEETINDLVDENFDFDSLDDPAFLQYLEDSVYANLESEFAGSEAVYQIDDISVTFISREYLEETASKTISTFAPIRETPTSYFFPLKFTHAPLSTVRNSW